MHRSIKGLLFVVFFSAGAALFLSPIARAYVQYNSGCQNCHGSFFDATSPKGAVIPGDKHNMHRSATYMDTDCELCHAADDGRNPFLGRSDGYVDTPGLGCSGCHQGPGLRAHHARHSVSCAGGTCHTSGAAPPAESVNPPYYGSFRTRANGACNLTRLAATNENWTTGDFLGMDNDGDGLYDAADPDCGAAPLGPGEALDVRAAAHDALNRIVALTYDSSTCSTTSNNLYWGPLSQVSSYTYSGRSCSIGNTGQYGFDYSSIPDSVFLLIVAHDDTREGSYGTSSAGLERPAAGLCPQVQDLANVCSAGP